MLCGDPETGRRAIVEDVDREALQADHLGEAIDDICDMVEGVGEVAGGRHVRLAEPRQVRRDDMEAVRQERNEIAEHMSRTREAVQQEQRWRFGWAGLAIEDIQAVDFDGPISGRNRHWALLGFLT